MANKCKMCGGNMIDEYNDEGEWESSTCGSCGYQIN